MTERAGEQQERGVGGMSARIATRLAWSVCAVTLLILTLSLLLIVLGRSTPLPQGWAPWRDQAVSVLGIIGAPILGAIIASHRPENPYGWLWLGFGFGLAIQQLAEPYTAYTLVVEPGSLVAPRIISRVLELGGPLALIFAPFLFLLFPTGRLPSRRWRPLGWIGALSGVALLAINMVVTRPDEAGGTIAIIVIVVVSILFATIGLSVLSPVIRYRRASGLERQQLKWFALAAVWAGAYIVGILLGLDRLLGEALWTLLDAATNTTLYVAVGIAILRYRLYDIDVLINRTLVYGSLTATLVALYFGSIIVLQRLFVILTGEKSTLAIVASTLVIAALFNPLRRHIQAFIDRSFYRRKYDARKTLEAFSARLRDETDLDTLNAHLVGVVAETMQPSHVSLWLRPDAGVKWSEPSEP